MISIMNVSSKGQVVIPEEIRKKLAIKAGSKLVVIEKNGTLVLKKEEELAKHMEEDEKRETAGWLSLAEKSLREVWDNPKDDKVWNKYL